MHSVYEDASGILWIATRRGLACLRDGKFSAIGGRFGLLDDLMFRILEDDSGYFWINSSRGILRIPRLELQQAAQGKLDRVSFDLYDAADGMKSPECVAVTQPAGWKTRDGRIWFPTTKGLVVINPADLRINTDIPPVFLERLIVDNQVQATGVSVHIPAGKGNVEFQYTALSFSTPEKVQFRYRLAGLDEHWINAGTRRSAYYHRIPPGE